MNPDKQRQLWKEKNFTTHYACSKSFFFQAALTKPQAEKAIEKYLKAFPKVKAWLDKLRRNN